jgi:hypothetical protein
MIFFLSEDNTKNKFFFRVRDDIIRTRQKQINKNNELVREDKIKISTTVIAIQTIKENKYMEIRSIITTTTTIKKKNSN